MMQPHIRRPLYGAALLVLLAGCGDDGASDVRRWMEETRRQAPVKVSEISPPKRFTPFMYAGKGAVDPYSPSKVAQSSTASLGTSSGRKPDLDRPREALELFPLDAMKMVGTMQKHGVVFALIQTGSTIFTARVGNHVGQNLGQITKITDSEIELTEIAQDASGEWVDRPAKLELQEKKK